MTLVAFRLLPAVALSVGLATSGARASAQSSTWIAPGPHVPAVAWTDPTNWDNATVPSTTGSVALFDTFTTGVSASTTTTYPGAADVAIDQGADITVDEIRYRLPGNTTSTAASLMIGRLGSTPAASTAGNLHLTGAGFTLVRTGLALFLPPTLSVQYGTLDFRNQASAGPVTFSVGADLFSGTGVAGRVVFHETSSAALATINVASGSSLVFQDGATAAQAKITGRGDIAFRDQSSAGSATLAGHSIVFQNTASAGSAQLTPTSDFALSSVQFRDQSSAGAATINLGKLGDAIFADNSDAGTAKVQFGSGAAGSRVLIQGSARTLGLSINTATGGRGTLDLSGANLSVSLASVTGFTNIELGGNSLSLLQGPSTLAGVISGTGGIGWDQTAVLIVSNPGNTYTGATSIGRGELRLDSGRVSNVSLGGNASLSGNGTVTGTLNNQGRVRPGNSPGTITVQGDYTQTVGASLDIEIASTTSYDQLAVSGTATLAGTLNLSFADGLIPVGNSRFAFLTAGAINGQFSTVNAPGGLGVALSSQLVYAPGSVSVQVTQLPFAGFGGASPAATALGGHLDATLAGSSGAYRDLVSQLNTLSSGSAVATALETLAPDRYSALAENGFLAAAMQQTERDRRMAALRNSSPRGFEGFFEAGQRRLRLAAPAAGASFDGGTAGAAWHNEGFALGASFTQEKGDLELDGSGSRANLRSLLPAAFFQYAAARWFVNASAAFSRDDYDLRRRVVLAGFDQTAAGPASGARHDFAVNVGAPLRFPSWLFTPQVGVLASRWQLDRFAETGATGANLVLPEQSINSLRTRAGFEATAVGARFSPQLAVFWLHETKDDRSLRAAFAGAGNSVYAAPGRSADANALQASLGFDWHLGRHAALKTNLAGLWGGEARVTSALSAALSWEF